MFTLGIPERQYRRATQVLSNSRNKPIDYEERKQEDGFYMFRFPGVDYDEFKNIVLLLKGNGVTTIGADAQLTEKNIMKLANLIEIEGPEPEVGDVVGEIEGIINKYSVELQNITPLFKIVSDLKDLLSRIDDQKEDFYLKTDLPENNITEQKLRKLIKDEFKKISRIV